MLYEHRSYFEETTIHLAIMMMLITTVLLLVMMVALLHATLRCVKILKHNFH